ncbi:hypothetical protein [Kitasatospora sp. NBC_00458]|uniref:hypothetical protein n=1 Tax=Kitasatospora sp. NBC_00458 TaxID=2903568 RepID=UPI002E1869E6
MTKTVARSRVEWWRAPMVSTLVTGLCLPILLFLRGLAEMALDPCPSEPGSCPATRHGLAFADGCLTATLVLLVVQWPVAFLLRPARVWAALAPGTALFLGVVTVFGVQPGQ